jgi:6-phosphofructokinase 2
MAAIVTLTMNPALDIATATERVVPTIKLRCEAPRYDPGGGGINVARAVHALGGDALAIFPAGGAAGEMIRHLLHEEGVAHEAIAIAGFMRESLAVEDLRTGNQYRFILPGPEISSADQERCLDQLSRAAAQADYIVASGSLPIGVPEDFYARVAALAKRQAKRLVLDTSGAALKQAGHGIYLLKPSLRELEDLTGRRIRSEREEEQAAREVVAQGRSEVVVVSLGPRGALVASAEGSERFPAIPVRAISTVGAGDSMLAGIVLDLYRGLPLREAVRFGMAAGAAALLGSGTQLCRLDDVERLYAQMSVTHVRRDKAALFQRVQAPPGDSLQPEATGAGMEATKCLKPPDSGHEFGDRASVQAATRVNAEQTSKRPMCRPTRKWNRGRLTRMGGY